MLYGAEVMKHLACIAIGINQYQFLEPLSYAQQDAEALHTLLIKEMGFLRDKCLLLTDTSPAIWGHSTVPSRENILNLIESLCQKQLEAEDILWCFFGGYGLSYKGEDYLMPIDGDLYDVEATGIPVKMLLDNLKKAPCQNVLVLLDINRSQNSTVDGRIATQTAELASQMEIPTILSCNSEQMACETSALRHGFFTAALLEGLGSGECTTFDRLESFLNYRLAELCDRYSRPKQNPWIVISPSEKRDGAILVPNSQVNSAGWGSQVGMTAATSVGLTLNKIPGMATTSSPELDSARAINGQQDKNGIRLQTNYLQNQGEGKMSQNTSQPIKSDKSFLQKLILGSGVLALLLLVGVILTNKSVFLGRGVDGVENSEYPDLSPAVTTSNSENPSNVSPQIVGYTVPQLGNISTESQILLDEARTSLEAVSASRFSEAIAKASLIQPNDPLYQAAQLDIERWSLTILDIADGRAEKEDYNGAIAAAQLIPDYMGEIYRESQDAIASWDPLSSKLQANQALLTAAKGLIKLGQASSYNEAIDKVREVPPGDPGYDEAQKLIADWSDTIFKIAQLRADRRNFNEAIRAAELVPPATPAYDTAQKAIADWKIEQQVNKKN